MKLQIRAFVGICPQKKFQLIVLLIGWDGQQFLREYSCNKIRKTLHQNLIFFIWLKGIEGIQYQNLYAQPSLTSPLRVCEFPGV